jgi:pimeloyl-ACP methyl ester carboxylesterase
MAQNSAQTLHRVILGPKDGLPVLLIHGWQCDLGSMIGAMEPIFAKHRSGFRRIYVDLPGHGGSAPCPPSVASSDDIFTALSAFIDETVGPTAQFLVVGYSYGGYLARAVAHAYGSRVAGACMLCPVAVPEKEQRRLPVRTMLRPDATLTEGERTILGIAGVKESAEILARMNAEVFPGMKTADREALGRIQEVAYGLSEDPPEKGEVFGKPTLILTGRQDSQTGYEDQWEMVSMYPRATFAVLDIAGHTLYLEQPEVYEALVREWLDRCVAEW